MSRIADLIVDVIEERRSIEDVRRDAVNLRRSFPVLRYGFATGTSSPPPLTH
jgi:hypothetical protein